MPRIEADDLASHRELVWGRILDAFGAEMDLHGFAELTLAGVAARAGLGRSSLYTYTRDKTDLMMRYVDRSVERYLTRMREQLAALPGAAERLAHAVRAQVAGFAAEPGAGSASGLLEGGSLPPEVFGELMGRLSRAHGLVKQILEEGIESGEFRRMADVDVLVEMIGAVVGSQRMPVGSGERSIEEASEAVLAFIDAAVVRR